MALFAMCTPFAVMSSIWMENWTDAISHKGIKFHDFFCQEIKICATFKKVIKIHIFGSLIRVYKMRHVGILRATKKRTE